MFLHFFFNVEGWCSSAFMYEPPWEYIFLKSLNNIDTSLYQALGFVSLLLPQTFWK